MTIGQASSKEFDSELPSSRRLMERVPSDKGRWKPHPRSSADELRNTINHFVDHRGQLTVYLRLLDVPIPQPYGPTADER